MPDNRAATPTQDSRLVNCYVEKIKESNNDEPQYDVFGRPGYTFYSQPTGGAATGLGMFNWQGQVYAIVGGSFYNLTTSTFLGTVDSTAQYKFNQVLGATPKMVFNNGAAAYYYDPSDGLVQLTNVVNGIPIPHAKGWAYLDSSLYIADTLNNINESGINDPTTWNALSVLQAQIEPDYNMFLCKQLVYVIDMKQWTTEVFYDAGNATGSALGPVQGAKVNYGCVAPDSVQDVNGVLVWVCAGKNGPPQVMIMDNTKPVIVSTAPIERLLKNASFTTTYSWQLKIGGHIFYVLTIKAANLTLVYDLTDKLWCQWTDVNGNYLPIVASTTNSSLQTIIQHESNGSFYIMDQQYYTDNGAIITKDIYTPNFDGGSRRTKHLNFMWFNADQVLGSVLLVRCNDWDYDPTRWTNYRRVELFKKMPYLANCGSFKRRALHLRHASPTFFRIQSIDLQINLGTL
jgi:hypothetical protein